MRPMGLARLMAVVLCALAAACSSTENVLRPSAMTSPAPQQGGQLAALGSDFRLGFDPVVGAGIEATRPLSARLSARAGESGIALAGPGDAASLSMKGYFSAISEDGVTTVIFVWDVVDPQGTRLHRIQGQQRAEGGSGEGWAAVGEATMEAIADETMSQLVAWLAMRQG
jgi:hypothetical protein